jgi:pre-mRNA-splicing factor 38A
VTYDIDLLIHVPHSIPIVMIHVVCFEFVMANRTDRGALRSHGADPQALIPHIVRDKIYNCRYWKEDCFALTAESIIDKTKALTCIGFSYGGFNRPSQFLCLLTKLLQISPDMEIIRAYIEFSSGRPTNDPDEQIHDLRYLRALVIAYIRLVGKPEVVYRELEPLLMDFRKIVVLKPSGEYSTLHMDEWVSLLLDHHNKPVYGFLFPLLTRRSFLVSRGDLAPYKSPLDTELGT